MMRESFIEKCLKLAQFRINRLGGGARISCARPHGQRIINLIFFVLFALKGMLKVFSHSTRELIILHSHFSVIWKQNFQRVYLKTIFLNLVNWFDTRLSIWLAYSRTHFVLLPLWHQIGFFFNFVQFLPTKKPCKIRVNLKKKKFENPSFYYFLW